MSSLYCFNRVFIDIRLFGPAFEISNSMSITSELRSSISRWHCLIRAFLSSINEKVEITEIPYSRDMEAGLGEYHLVPHGLVL